MGIELKNNIFSTSLVANDAVQQSLRFTLPMGMVQMDNFKI